MPPPTCMGAQAGAQVGARVQGRECWETTTLGLPSRSCSRKKEEEKEEKGKGKGKEVEKVQQGMRHDDK